MCRVVIESFSVSVVTAVLLLLMSARSRACSAESLTTSPKDGVPGSLLRYLCVWAILFSASRDPEAVSFVTAGLGIGHFVQIVGIVLALMASRPCCV